MQQNYPDWSIKKKLIVSLAIFAVSYVIFLFLWLAIQNHYGKGLLFISSHLTAKVKDISFDFIKAQEDDKFASRFFIPGRVKGFDILISFDFSLFTYNAPLTFAIMAALFLFIKNHFRAYAEVLVILFAVHFFYIFLSQAGRISWILDKNNLEKSSEVSLFIWQYLWAFIDAMVIRFEPFLIGIYLYLRFPASAISPAKNEKNKGIAIINKGFMSRTRSAKRR